MQLTLQTFLRDQRGSLLTTEWAVVATILVLGAFSYLAAHQANLRGERSAFTRTLE